MPPSLQIHFTGFQEQRRQTGPPHCIADDADVLRQAGLRVRRCDESWTVRVATSQVLVVVIFVDWFYQINEWLLARSDRRRARTALVAGTLLFYLGSVVAIGFMFRSYAPKASCGTNIAFLSLTLLGTCPVASAGCRCVCCGTRRTLLCARLPVLQAERWTLLPWASFERFWDTSLATMPEEDTARQASQRPVSSGACTPLRSPFKDVVLAPEQSRFPLIGLHFGLATCCPACLHPRGSKEII